MFLSIYLWCLNYFTQYVNILGLNQDSDTLKKFCGCGIKSLEALNTLKKV